MSDIRKFEQRPDPQTGAGDGAAYGRGYGAGGLGADQHAPKPEDRDAPGVTPAGERTGASTDGPRIAMDGEAEPDAERFGEDDVG